MSTSYFQVIAHYHVKPDQQERVCALLAELAEASRQEPANLDYDFFRSPGNPSHFVILERYTDASGFDTHRASDHFQQIGIGQIIPLLERREVSSHTVNSDG